MKTVRRFSGWFFLVIGAFGLFRQPIAGLVFLSWSALLLPFTNQLAVKRGLHLDLWKRLGTVVIGIVLISLTTPRSQSPQFVTQQVTPSPTPSSSAPTKEAQPNPPTKTATPSPESKETSVGALVQKKGLDFSYETAGRVQKTDKSIIVNYTRTWQCGAEAPVSTARQEWQTVFDLSSKTWTDKVKELSNCLGNANQEWIDYSTTPSQFSIESSDKETVIRADGQDTDGSIIVKDELVVRYKAEDNVPPSNNSSAIPESSSTPSLSQSSKEGVLVAQDSKTQINVRTGAGLNFPSRHYGLVGDKVIIMSSVRSEDGSTWYQIKFPISGADGWVRSDFIQAKD
jgi:hypothetical protein